MKKIIFCLLIILLLSLQYRLWIDKQGMRMFKELKRLVKTESTTNQGLIERNNRLDVQVRALKKEPDALEEHARMELGMIKKGETFYVVLDPH
jgi:cell division protein FtsB